MRSVYSQLRSQDVIRRAEEASSDGTADAGIGSMSKAMLNMIGYRCCFIYAYREFMMAKTWLI